MNAISFVFMEGQFRQDLSDISLLPEAIVFQPQKNQFTLHIPKQHACSIHFKYLNGCDEMQNKVIVDENSHLMLVEEYTSADENNYKTDFALELQLNKHAIMHYYKIQNENLKTKHQGNIQVTQKESSELKMFFADCGSQQSLSHVNVDLSERDAQCYLHGLYFLNHDDQVINNAINIKHNAEFSKSAMVFKGVLDKKSKAQFQGKVYVAEMAKRTHAHQENHNLLLSTQADVKTEPQLEIYADDIKCTHGATVGQLDEDAMFYLRSRGIDEAMALKMLTEAFVAEIMEKIDDTLIRTYIHKRVAQHEVF